MLPVKIKDRHDVNSSAFPYPLQSVHLLRLGKIVFKVEFVSVASAGGSVFGISDWRQHLVCIRVWGCLGCIDIVSFQEGVEESFKCIMDGVNDASIIIVCRIRSYVLLQTTYKYLLPE